MIDMTQTTASAPSRVTIDDVRMVLAGVNPNQTNGGKVRVLLGGRGSFETIQKHLNTLRQELATASAPPVTADQVPALPTEAAQAIWVAAWTAAQVQTMTRAEKLAAERDSALLKLDTMGQDVAGLVATVDEQTTALDQAAATAAKVQAAHLTDVDRLEADHMLTIGKLDEAKQELERNRTELVKVQADAAHAAELAESGRVMMREELARLTDQVGELKAHLYRRADAAPAVVTPSPAG